MKKLFRTDKEMAEEFVRLAVNKRLRLGRYLFLFPHVVEGKTFQTPLIQKWLCWLVTIILTTGSIWFVIMINEQIDAFSFLLWVPLLSSYVTLLINQIWMHIKKDKLDDFLSNLQECRPYLQDGNDSLIDSVLPLIVQILMNFGFWAYVMLKERIIRAKFSIMYFYFQLGLLLCYGMLEQFILLLSVVRQQLLRTPILSDRDHDALIAAAVDLNKVYSPHLLVIITTLFVAILGKIYKSFTIGEVVTIPNIVVVALQSYPVWRVVSNCQVFVKEVEEFYNRTYHYLLTHQHKIEKRMELHLGMKRKFKFSAGGMFSVDFQLLSGMITTAATYIVVLLQFTMDKSNVAPGAVKQ